MQNLRNIREDVKIPHSKMCPKKMLEDIGNLFVKCMRQVTKSHLCHLLGLSDYYVRYRQRAFCERSAKVTNWVTDPFRWFCELV